MNVDVEDHLRRALPKPSELPAAPEALRERLEQISATRAIEARRGPRPLGLVVAAACLLLAVPLLASVLRLSVPPDPGVTVPTANASPAVVATGTVMTVSQFLAAAATGSLPDAPLLLRGYWSDRSFPHSCPALVVTPLEDTCHVHEWGITEENEAALEFTNDGTTRATGPAIWPFVDDESIVKRLFALPLIDGLPHPPVPIVVEGHVSDPRAAECLREAQDGCRQRLVIDRLVEFDPDGVPRPTPSPTPSPFPFDSPPPAQFPTDVCLGGADVDFAGWIRYDELRLAGESDPSRVVYAVIGRDDIVLKEWGATPSDPSKQRRLWGRRLCYAQESATTIILQFEEVPGSTYWEYDDGTREPLP